MKLIATTIAASILSFNVMAADSSHCNSLDKGPQFNKTELSAFDKCWLNTHNPDKLSGVDGKVFWIKVNDEYLSIDMKDMINAGTKSKRLEVVKEKVINKVITNTITIIENRLTDAQQRTMTFVGEFLSNPAGNDQMISNYLRSHPSAFRYTLANGQVVEGYHQWDAQTTLGGKLVVLSDILESQRTAISRFW